MQQLLVPVDHPLSQMNFKGLNKLFLSYSMAVPASASVQRLFNIANQVLTKKQLRLSGTNIDTQLLLTSSKKLY